MVERRVVRVTVPTELADVVTDLLWQFGPEAVSETASSGETTFIAGYPSIMAAEAAHSRLGADHHAQLEAVPDQDDWVAAWRQHEPSHDVGPLHIRLPEHAPATDRLEVVIEPGATFGYSHPSTLLALELLTRLDLARATVADVGCGSGVLAIAAGRLGAGSVDAVDIDPAAVAATEENSAANGVPVTARLGRVDALPREGYDVVVANMLAVTLEAAATELVAHVAAGGALVLSGMLAGDRPRIDAAFAPTTAELTRMSGEWLAMVRA